MKAFTDEIERVHGKEGLLVKIAEAACLQPEGMVRDVVFSAAGGADVLDAIDWLRRAGDDSRRIIRPEDGVPVDGVAPPKWRDLILEKDSAGGLRVNRANYEICVLTGIASSWTTTRCVNAWCFASTVWAPMRG